MSNVFLYSLLKGDDIILYISVSLIVCEHANITLIPFSYIPIRASFTVLQCVISLLFIFFRLYDLIKDFSPDIIGFRAMTFYKNFFHDTVAYNRDRGVSQPIITGGPYSTASYRELLEEKMLI